MASPHPAPPGATDSSSATGAAPSGYPAAATSSPPQTIAPTSASSASAARSTAARAAAASVSADDTTARNSASCCVDQAGPGMSAQRKNDQGLVVEAADPSRTSDLAVGIEPCDGRSASRRREPVDLGSDPPISEHPAPCDAVEGQYAQRRASVEPGERVTAGGVGRLQHGFGVALHDPDQPALRDLRDAVQRALGEVGPADKTHLPLLAGAAAQPERVGEREAV